jgi:DNA-binding FadR family transcriptional regulator
VTASDTKHPALGRSFVGARADKLSSVLARAIVSDVLERRLKPGTVLPSEAAMAEHFGVGRASLREALRLLEVYGLIKLKPGPGGGPILSSIGSDDFGRAVSFYFHFAGVTLGELHETRSVLEPTIARLAAERITPENAAKLKAALEAERATIESGEGIAEGARDFHRVLASITGNQLLEFIGSSLIDIEAARLAPAGTGDFEFIHKVHARLAQAIIDGRPEEAARLAAAHIIGSSQEVGRTRPGVVSEVIEWL